MPGLMKFLVVERHSWTNGIWPDGDKLQGGVTKPVLKCFKWEGRGEGQLVTCQGR